MLRRHTLIISNKDCRKIPIKQGSTTDLKCPNVSAYVLKNLGARHIQIKNYEKKAQGL